MTTMTKEELLEHWNTLEDNLPILPHMTPVPYKAKGSRYGACGIRIDGNPDFIDAVLSRIKDLLEGENDETRLSVSRSSVNGAVFNKSFSNRDDMAEVCYIRLAERGGQAVALNTYMSAIGHSLTKRKSKGKSRK